MAVTRGRRLRRACRRPAPAVAVSRREHLGDVPRAGRAPAPVQPAGDVHQAAHVGADDHVGAGGRRWRRAFGRASTPRCRPSSRRTGRRSRSTVCASPSGFTSSPSTASSSASGCALDPEPAQAVAARVVGRRWSEAAAARGHAGDVHEELRELVGARRHRRARRAGRGIRARAAPARGGSACRRTSRTARRSAPRRFASRSTV